MVRPAIPKPTRAELELLQIMWQCGPSTAKQAHEALLEHKPDASYAGVLRQLQLMHAKGLLKRDESARAHVYAAAQAQDAQQTHLLKDLITRAFSGSGKALVLAALKGGHVSKEEREEIQKFLDQQK